MTQYRRWAKTNWTNSVFTKCQNSVYGPQSYSRTAVFTLPGQPSTQLYAIRDKMVRGRLLLWMLNTQIYTSDLTTNKNTVHGLSEPFPKDISRTRLPPVTSWFEPILAKSNILSSLSDIFGHPLIWLMLSYTSFSNITLVGLGSCFKVHVKCF